MRDTIEHKKKTQRDAASTYKTRARNITNLHELLPGLNDISDAFEALPLDIVKYFTLLKEIDAKCINTVPQINTRIKSYIDSLHNSKKQQQTETSPQEKLKETHQLSIIKNKINEIIPCLEEKMHVTSVATDLLNKHMYRINQDYKLIIQNNEIPENVRIGPLIHPAMILDSTHGFKDGNGERTTGGGGGNNQGTGNSGHNGNSSQTQRSESRREVLAARKANKEDDRDGTVSGSNSGRKKKIKEQTPLETNEGKTSGNESKKRGRNDDRNNNNNNNSNNSNNSNNNNNSSGNHSNSNSNSNNNRNNSNNNNSSSSSGGSKKKLKKSEINTDDEVKEEQVNGMSNYNSNSNNNKKNAMTSIEKPRSGAGGGGGGGNEPTYCYCNQVSFGEMVGCDGEDCKREWFHLPCIGFKNPPKGKWYCDDCIIKMKKPKRM
ncbi:hypothetical protein KGF56_002675 [Candida oxycetoniae]|uniref:Chromatin modification-related protein n=1 Tax=Candida oxycetoniae TaxID=497107 RepID=A0AAI9WXQ3_9ASCO|nr:uncharacterized protein KGF56_002675 [Candida oxycetoniae]KAI3404483.2 hypothetical protein KGF56_002675 [Candida oxycetoniae]